MNSKLLSELQDYSHKNPDFSLCKIYKYLNKSFKSNDLAFTVYIKCIMALLDYQYDFKWLSLAAKTLSNSSNTYKRNDIQILCDDLCQLFGENIDDLCANQEILVAPSKFEKYCPFSNDSVVIYSNKPITHSCIIDGIKYVISDSKAEKTPYYNIVCHSILED